MFHITPESALLRLGREYVFEALEARELTIFCRPQIAESEFLPLLLGASLATLQTQRGLPVLHGSSIEIRSRAYCFIGPSGRGKSTLAAQLARRSHRLLSDGLTLVARASMDAEATFDASALRAWRSDLDPGGFDDSRPVDRATRRDLPSLREQLVPLLAAPSSLPRDDSLATLLALPGPPVSKLDDGALVALGHDPKSFRAVHSTSPKRLLPFPDLERPPPLPLAHVFVLEDGDEISVEPLHGLAKLEALATNMYLAAFVPGPLPPLLFQQAAHVARCVPVSILKRPRGFEHTEHVLDFIESLATRGASRDPGSGASEGAASTR